jgi:hypothetical protein
MGIKTGAMVGRRRLEVIEILSLSAQFDWGGLGPGEAEEPASPNFQTRLQSLSCVPCISYCNTVPQIAGQAASFFDPWGLVPGTVHILLAPSNSMWSLDDFLR